MDSTFTFNRQVHQPYLIDMINETELMEVDTNSRILKLVVKKTT